MALGGVISVGRQATTASLFTVSRHLRAKYNVSSIYSIDRSIHFTQNQKGKSLQSHIAPGKKYLIRAINGVAEQKKDIEKPLMENWKIKMLYDGECPLCMREVDMLRERNKNYGTIKFVDISSDEYSPENNQGLDYETVMGRIHAIMSDGTVVKDVEAFRKLYEVVGLGWVYAITKYEPIASIADAVYGVWAKYRLQITGRPGLEKVMEARKQKKEACEDSKTCKL